MSDAKKSVELSPRETEIMMAAFKAFKTWPEIDNEKLAELLGMSNPRSASNAMANIRKKIFGSDMPSTPKKAGRKPKDVESSATKTPQKRKITQATGDEENIVSPVPIKKAKTIRKPKTSWKSMPKSSEKVEESPEEDSKSNASTLIDNEEIEMDEFDV